MERSNVKGLVLVSLVSLMLLGAVAVWAFVPSCEEELAQAYPSQFVADLGSCDEGSPQPVEGVVADASEFASRLNGTWELNLRTHNGLPDTLVSGATRLYIDMQATADAQIRGTALMINRDNGLAAAEPAADVAGFWTVAVDKAQQGTVEMTMSLGAPDHFAEAGLEPQIKHRFIEDKGIFVSVKDDERPADTWDRVVWMPNSVTYISCERGAIERYAKVSDQRPTIDGVSLGDYWQKIEVELAEKRTVAAVAEPATTVLSAR